MNSIKNLAIIRRACYALLLGCALAFSGCVPVTTVERSTSVGMPPEDADYALQKLNVEGAEFVPLVKGADGRLHPAHTGRDLESTNNLGTALNLTPAPEWWLRSDERVAPTITHYVGEYIDANSLVTTCDLCAFARCLDNSSQIPVNPSFNLTRTLAGGTSDPPQGINLLDICQTRRRLELSLSADETLALTGLDLTTRTLAQTQLRVVPQGGPRSFISPPLKPLPGGNTPARFYFAIDAGDPASLPGASQRWSVNFSPNLPARALRLFQQGGGQPLEPVNFSRVNAVTGCITGYDASGNPAYNLNCITPERYKCNPVNGDGRIELTNTAFCPQGAVNATPNYFLDNSSAPSNRIFWVIEFDGGAPALAPGRELAIEFTL